MSLKLSISDGATPILDQIAAIHLGQAKDALDHAGSILRDSIRDALVTSEQSDFHVVVKNGKRHWTRGSVGRFGDRFNFKKAGPQSMANMVNSFFMSEKLMVIVGGMNKNVNVNTWRDGKVSGSIRLGQVLAGSYEILKKLNNGGDFNSQTERYKRTRMGEDTKPMGSNPKYKARKFIERGRSAAMGEVNSLLTDKLQSMIYRQANSIQAKTVTRTTA